jgi:hypothetical protein
MNDKRENKFSRNLKVETFFNNHEAEVVVAAPGLAAFVADYRAKNVELTDYGMISNVDITGSSVEKTMLRNEMRDLAVGISGALYSYFLSIKKPKAAKEVYLTKSKLDNARDSDVYFFCKWTLESAQENSAAIIPLGATAAKITALSDAIDAYVAMIQDPQDERGNKSAAMEDFDRAMSESEDILEIIKGIMQMLKGDFPSLHSQFLSACAIDDNVGGGSPSLPDYEFTVLPGAFYTALTIPYSASRSFKAKNLSSNWVILWGLSNLEGGFTNTPVPLNNDASSTLLSTTLGGSGDFLIFNNPTSEPVSVELTVIED